MLLPDGRARSVLTARAKDREGPPRPRLRRPQRRRAVRHGLQQAPHRRYGQGAIRGRVELCEHRRDDARLYVGLPVSAQGEGVHLVSPARVGREPRGMTMLTRGRNQHHRGRRIHPIPDDSQLLRDQIRHPLLHPERARAAEGGGITGAASRAGDAPGPE